MAIRSDAPCLVWFRDDLRLEDNAAVEAAAAAGGPWLGVYVLDTGPAGPRPLGGAARWWLHHSLAALGRALAACGGRLVLRRGAAPDVLTRLVQETGARAIHACKRHDPAATRQDRKIAGALAASGARLALHRGNLLFDPADFAGPSGRGFKVFSPFWRACLAAEPPPSPRHAPARVAPWEGEIASDALESWGLTPQKPDWAAGLRATWTPGAQGARDRLQAFLDDALAGYADQRDRPDRDGTARLSPHLRFGEISVRQVWHAVLARAEAGVGRRHVDKFLAELGWREFSYHLLHHHPELATANLQRRFDGFAWQADRATLRAWQRGCTGYPLVDAGMRQLWTTGWMHNRVRMVVASFLVKHLLTDWQRGEAWFWDTLVDADPANNAASWQWVAGSGADAAPYVRVYNPVLQGQKFDPDGAYVRRWVPELAGLPAAAIHAPWQAAADVLAAAGVVLGKTYPRPIVDHAAARARALAAYAGTREAALG